MGSLPPRDVVDALRAAGCVFAEDEARLLVSEAGSPAELGAMVEQRVGGVPLEIVLGWAEFCGLRIRVERGVFVPRRRTEFLAAEAIRVARGSAERTGRVPVVVDLCCGSGAIGFSISAAIGDISLHAADDDPVAVACARRNLSPDGDDRPRGIVYEGDLYDALPADLMGTVDLIVANAPYVPTDAVGLMPEEARVHEPREALDGGADGLDIHRRIAARARRWLAPGGVLLVETSAAQASRSLEIFTTNGLSARSVMDEETGTSIVAGTAP